MAVQKLREGKRVVGTMVRMIQNPAVAVVAHNAGLDFIMLDLEHGPYTMETVGDVFKVGRALGIGCFVRVPELAKGYVSRALDCGATGVMVPMLESVEQAELLVRWAKFAPLGGRGFGGAGGHSNFIGITPDATPAFMAKANVDTIAIAQIETAMGLENVEAIAAVEGLDMLYIGPSDLGLSIGREGRMDQTDPVVVKAIDHILKTAKAAGLKAGIFCIDPAYSKAMIAKGFDLVTVLSDTTLVNAGPTLRKQFV
jgi:2-keto-3-deoxy-L-rhamnonate aldolase RhmA